MYIYVYTYIYIYIYIERERDTHILYNMLYITPKAHLLERLRDEDVFGEASFRRGTLLDREAEAELAWIKGRKMALRIRLLV